MRVIGKILSAIIVGLLSMILFALDQVAKVYSLVAGLFYILLGVCVILAFLSKQWTAIGILGVLFLISLLVFFTYAGIIIMLERVKDMLL